MLPTARILVVDDEVNIRTSLKEMLERDGHHVVTAESGEAALALFSTHEFDLALIDLRLTGIGGIEVLTALRQQSPNTVAIVLTAHASLETAVEALRKGAHDYLFKPCKPAELRESIRKGLADRQGAQHLQLLQQVEQMSSSLEDIRTTILGQIEKPPPVTIQPPEREHRFLQRGELIVDLLRHVITVDGHLLDLSPTEFDLLVYLIRKAPQIVSPQELVRGVQGYESEQWEASETIRQHIYRIRQKIKQAAGRANVIRTVRGVGYTIDE
ncbi:MAG: response regulator transcription factor [Anaerolineae bacterium]